MGVKDTKSLTESGLKYISYFFIFTFGFNLILLLFSISLIFSEDNWFIISTSSFNFTSVMIIISFFILIWIIRGLADIFNGRKEFNPSHESNVIYATILLIVYFILFLIDLVLAKGFIGGTTFISALKTGFTASIIPQFIGVLILSIICQIILGLALINLVQNLLTKEQEDKIWKAFYLLIAGNFTFNISALIGYFYIYKVYREIGFNLKQGEIKAAVTAPCPFCNNDIPIDSSICPYCNTKFDKKEIEIDSRLSMEAPKSQYSVPRGYTPTQGPSELEKKKVKKIITTIIVLVVVIAALYTVLKIVTSEDKSSQENLFIGTWQGGLFDGTNYANDEKWTFYANNSLKIEDNTGTEWLFYSFDSSELCKRDPSISSVFCFNYELSNGDRTITLEFVDSMSYRFNKI